MTISEKVAYLKGLAEGMGLKADDGKDGKLFSVIIEILEEVGLSIEDLEDTTEMLSEGLDALSDDLEDVEDFLFEDEDDDDDEDDDEDFFSVACPNCGTDLDIDEDVLETGSVTCTSCNQSFAIDLTDDCGCGCGCEHEEEDDD